MRESLAIFTLFICLWLSSIHIVKTNNDYLVAVSIKGGFTDEKLNTIYSEK